MACTLTAGRPERCKEFVGGIKSIYFIPYGTMTTITYDTATAGEEDQILTVAGVTALFKYDLKGANSFEQTVTSSRENGTTFAEQTLTFTVLGEAFKAIDEYGTGTRYRYFFKFFFIVNYSGRRRIRLHHSV